MFALKLFALTLVLLNLAANINGCENCEAPWGTYCCKTAHNGMCCEYPVPNPLDMDEARTPLARHMLDNDDGPGKMPTKPPGVKAYTDNTPGRKATMA